jgi:hypothetical protein
MKAPMSPFIAAVLRDPRSAQALVSAVLRERGSRGKCVIEVRKGELVKRYRL